MKQSQLFTKTRKEAPADENSKNAELLIRAGYIYKELAGAYVFLPLGLRVLNNIADIIREEMDAIGGQEVQSTALQRKELWQKTGRWDDAVVDNWFKTKLKNGSELALAFTHEEPMTDLMKSFISSYKDLPAYPYDIRTIFRNEERAKSGILRGREFFWKALYSFSKDKEQHDEFYEKIKQAYLNIYERVGIGDKTFVTFASGGTFSKYSHEFQTICDAGEDTIFLSQEKKIAINKEVFNDEVLNDLSLNRGELSEFRAVEVGNIFSLGERFSEPLELRYMDETGTQKNVFMGSYGIGISRLLGVVVETLSDDKGIVMPEEIAPFSVHILALGNNENLFREAENLYFDLKNAGIEVLFDDRDIPPAQKLQDADLVGIPYRVVVSEKASQNGGIEITHRKTGEKEYLDPSRLVSYLMEG
ncbi:MAG: His/Gly/Thr/Pro-type tRNA ligase C-terminal domain-containing protein [Candidatus Pacebacteria bacterium]|nr:His/Gly/Thr/Pro-type tRNA ligase C-terminal domain-containing protein [Candidatus Paceibacterota bacterium]